MSELPKIFEDAKVGDDVLCPRRGWLKIQGIRCHYAECYPIKTEYESYMLDGKLSINDKAPSLWPADKVPQYYLDLFPRPKKKVKKVIERWLLVSKDGCTNGEVYLESPPSCWYFNTPVRVTGEYEVEE